MTTPTHDPYAAWRSPSYRRYAIGWFSMTFANAVEGIAAGYLIYLWTHQYLALGLIGLVRSLPVLLLAVPGGQMADRYDRRQVVATMLGLNTAVALGLAAAVAWRLPLSSIYALLAVGAMGQALGGPSRAALLPRIVPEGQFPNAVAWNTGVFHAATMTGPAFGGFVLDLPGGPTGVFLLVAGCRLLALGAISQVRYAGRDQPREPISRDSLLAGIRFVRENKLILASITLDLFAVLLGGATYLLPVFAEDVLGVGAWGLGMLRSAEAVGAVSMAAVLAFRPPLRRAGSSLLWAVAGFGAATIVFGLSRSFALSLAMMFLIGALDDISVVVRHTLVQMLTPDAMRGRVSAVHSIFIVASNELGGLESGLVAHFVGPVLATVGGGVGALAVVALTIRIWPELLAVGSLAEVRPLDQAQAAEQADDEQAARRG